jgi:integrase
MDRYLEVTRMPRRKALSQIAVEKLRYDPKRGNPNEIPDHLYPALRLVLQPTGRRSFAVRTRIGGKPVKITLDKGTVGLDLALARAATRDLLAEIAAGKDPRVAKRGADATTLGGVAELYLKATAAQVRPRTHVERERHLRRDWAPFHAKPITKIGKREIAARLLEIAEQHGAIAANRSRTSLFSLFAWAVDQDLIESNTVASTRPPLRRETARSRVLHFDERRALWAATEGGGAYNAIVRLLLMLGQRRDEVGGMKWAELDLDKAVWSLPPERTKNALPHLIPLPQQAVEIIAAQPRRGEHVFAPERVDAPFRSWSREKRRLDRRCNVKDFVLHDLRRTFVTAMNGELGIPPHVVEATVNHISGEAKRGVAGRYNRAQYLKERTLALQAWADHLTAAPADRVVEFRQAAGTA